MTNADVNLLDLVQVHVTPDTDAEALIAGMEHVNRTVRENPATGIVWFLQREPGEWNECLWAGVRGDLGGVTWWSAGADQAGYVPEGGTNTETMDYYFSGGHVCPMEPGAELPISRVYDLVREYVATGERPAGVGWVTLDD